MSDDGRFTAFQTWTTNLLDYTETDTYPNMFWMDRETRIIHNAQHVGGATDEAYYGGASRPAISRNGESIVFQSTNTFIPGNGGYSNIFVSAVRSKADGTAAPTKFKMISRAPNGDAGNGNLRDVYLIDRIRGVTTLISSGVGGTANDQSAFSAFPDPVFHMSSDGRYIVFSTNATNMGFEGNNGSENDIIFIDRIGGVRDRVEAHDPGAAAGKAALERKVKKLKLAIKKAKKSGNKSKVKRLIKQLKAAQRELASLG